jgi:hypothetical protein
VNVSVINDVPVAEGQSVSVNEEIELEIQLVGRDVDDVDSELIYEVVGSVGNGSIDATDLSTGKVRYTSDKGYVGSDEFSYLVRDDGLGESSVVTVSILVIDVPDAPVVNSGEARVSEDGEVLVTLSGVDEDGNMGQFMIVGGLSSGVLSQEIGGVRFEDIDLVSLSEGVTESVVIIRTWRINNNRLCHPFR